MVRVKICGNRSIQEALMAVEAGADAVGLIVGVRHRSEDALDPDIAGKIVNEVPPFVSTVLVTHLLYASEIIDIHRRIGTSTIQLHDSIKTEEIYKVRKSLPYVRLIKAVHVIDNTAIEAAETVVPFVDAVLLDSRTADRIGGTGMVHDWAISSKIVSSSAKPVILAGGLTPDNVREAVERVRPYGVDVNSGVEFPDGRKHPQKIRDFVRLAKEYKFD